MSSKRRNSASAYNCACMKWQYSPLMTQTGPYRTKKVNLDIFLCRPDSRPYADLSAHGNLEICRIWNSYKRLLQRVLNYNRTRISCYRRKSACDFDKHIDVRAISSDFFKATQRQVTTRVPT